MNNVPEIMHHFNNSYTLDESKLKLSALGYALKRLSQFEASWILDFPSYEDKITLGLSIGYTVESFSKIYERLDQLNTVNPQLIAPSKHVVSLFDDLAQTDDLIVKKHFIVSINHSISQYVDNLIKNLDPLYDQPGLLTLRLIKDHFNEKLMVLNGRGWINENLTIPDLSIRDESFIEWTPNDWRPTLTDIPARPEFLEQSDTSILNAPSSQLITYAEGIQRLLHFIYADIEVLAAEVCARNIIDFGDSMPVQFSVDMARQCSDEARHAIMVGDLLQKYGGNFGQFTYTNRVWTSYMKGESLSQKLAIQQLIDEGNGLDSSAVLIAAFEKQGKKDLVKMYKFLMADETLHCAFGNRWLNHLTGDDADIYESVIDKSLERGGSRVPGGAPLNIHSRRAAEYPEWFIQKRLAPQ